MIISSLKAKRSSIVFSIYNFLVYLFFYYFVIDKIIKNNSTVVSFGIMMALAVISSFIYILIIIIITFFVERKLIRESIYRMEYGCSLFYRRNTKYIVELKKKSCNIYANSLYLRSPYYPLDLPNYVKEQYEKLQNIKISDIIFIYLYKYADALLMSVTYYVVWHFCSLIIVETNILKLLIFFILLIFAASIGYYAVSNICSILIRKHIKKRDLEIFIS